TNQVKDTKINRLVHDYELFTMLKNGNISSMYACFNDIINSLKGLGKVYTNHELVSKILRCLPKTWEPKVTAIEEAKDLSTLPLEDLLGSLMTHELMNDQAKNEPKKKTIALKASKDEDSDEDKDEMALLTKRIRRILLDKKNLSKKQLKKFQSKGDSSKSYPKLKKKKDKKKAMIATWSDSDDSSSDEDENEEIANIDFMAMEDNNEVCSTSLSDNDLQNEYNELIDVLD
ncbi:LOW QUALITY PROTEIN: UBN2 domain-containing protein, partial [Cephalotus follicularis]